MSQRRTTDTEEHPLDSTARETPATRPSPTAADVDFVLFDIGGVLADVDQTRAERRWVELGLSADRFHAAFYDSGAKPGGDLGTLDSEGMRAAVSSEAGRAVTAAELLDVWGAMVWWRPWVLELLERLTRPHGVLSTIDPVHAAALGPLPGAEPLLYSCDIGAVKPDPRAFLIAVARCPAPAARVVYVDDRADNVAEARRAGLNAYQVVDRAGVERVLEAVLSR